MNLIIHVLIYCVLISVLLYGSLAYNPRMWLHRMPAVVIAKVPPRTPEERKLLIKTVGIPFMLLLVAYPTVFVLLQEANWLNYFLILCAFFAGFDVWDTLILDLLIFCKLTPPFVIIEGTERKDYSNMRYHLVSGAKGLVLSIAFSAVYALILVSIKGIIS